MIPVARFIPQVHPCPPIQTYHPEQLCHVFCSSEQRPANSIALGEWFQICTRLAPGHKFGIYPLRTITCYQREHIQALQANAVFSQTSLLSNAQQNRMHSVASNFLGDSSPAPRFGAGTGAPAPRLGVGTGVGSPAPRLCVGTGVPAPRFGAGTGVVFPILPSGLPRSFLHALLPPRPDPRPSSSRTLAYASPWNTCQLFEDTRLRLSMEHLYYPLRAGTTAAHLPLPSNARPLGPERPFQPRRDSDRLLRRRPPRSRYPRRPPEPPPHRRRPEWSSTPTPSVINGFLSPYLKGAAGQTRSRSPSRGSRPSPQAWTPRDHRDRKRPRSDPPTRPAPPS